MAYNQSRIVELYLLKAEKFNTETAPNQRKYYLDAARWLQENEFDSEYHMMEAMKNTPYYTGAAEAKTLDEIDLCINAMEKAGYDDVAEIHRGRKHKFLKNGNIYAFSPEWMEDYQKAGKVIEKYSRRKEVFGKIFTGYVQLIGNPQSQHRKDAVKMIEEGLRELQSLNVTFDELARDKVYHELTMTTEKGMQNFIDYIHTFSYSQGLDEVNMPEIKNEQNHLKEWVESHKEEIIKAGQGEKWSNACCVAVPSNAPEGYDFVAMKEVE